MWVAVFYAVTESGLVNTGPQQQKIGAENGIG